MNTGDFSQRDKMTYWRLVSECLIHLCDQSPEAAWQAVRSYRARLQQAPEDVNPEIIYHMEPWVLALKLGGKEDRTLTNEEHSWYLAKMQECATDAILDGSYSETYGPHIKPPYAESLLIPFHKIHLLTDLGESAIDEIGRASGVEIAIEKRGAVRLYASSESSLKKTIAILNRLVSGIIQPGKLYRGRIVETTQYGALIRIGDDTETLILLKELTDLRINHANEVVEVGETVSVKCLKITSSGSAAFSLKAALNELRAKGEEGEAGHGYGAVGM